MQNQDSTNWAFRIAFTLGLILGVGWGFLLGVSLIRVNTLFLLPGMILVGIPVAFAGSAILGAALGRLFHEWHRVAILLLVVIVGAIGLPLGLGFAVYEQQLDPIAFVNTTGSIIWYTQGAAGLLGLIAGLWSGWSRPVGERLGNLLVAVLARPLAVLRFIVTIPGRVVEAIASFFESMGRGFMWAPLQLVRIVKSGAESLRSGWARLWNRTPSPRSAAQPPTQVPETPAPRRQAEAPTTPRRRKRERKQLRLPQLRSQSGSNHNGDGPRVLEVVEDRCPYCFDVIKRRDPRGVQVCPVCGTPHHADCWAVTGTCQMPHLNT